MKVYVDELPKECLKCPCRSDIWCNIEHYYIGNMDKVCPLQSLSDYTKQVRKEVCEEIFRAFNKKIDDEFGDNDTKYITLDVEDVNFYLKDLVERFGEEK